jgi:hypothetical protein
VVDDGEQRGVAGHVVGARQPLRHVDLVVETVVGGLERRDHRQDGHAVLARLGAPGRERPTVVDAVDRERDGDGEVARAEEVRVQRVHGALRPDGALGRDERLGHDLTAEDPAQGLGLRRAREDVLAVDRAGRREVEGREEALQGRGGHPM